MMFSKQRNMLNPLYFKVHTHMSVLIGLKFLPIFLCVLLN